MDIGSDKIFYREGRSSKSAVGCAAVLIGVCNFHPKSDPYHLEGVITLLLGRMD